MGLAFLAPLFLAGLLAVAIPIVVHLTNRDRRDVVRFPSLRFLTRIPYRQVRRQRIRDWLLFLLRAAAVILLAIAFARPLVTRGPLAASVGVAGRDVVVLLDRSYSMGYADTWNRAVAAVSQTLGALGPEDRASLVTFADQATTLARGVEPAAATAALAGLAPGPGTTRFAPALQIARDILEASELPEREVVLVSDFQASGWDRSGTLDLPPGTAVTPVDLSARDPANVVLVDATVHGATEGGRAAFLLSVRLANQGRDSVRDLPVTLSLNGQEMTRTTATVAPGGSATVQLGPVAEPSTVARAVVRIGADRLPIDNDFYLTVRPEPPRVVLLLEAPGTPAERSLFLREALGLLEDPGFTVVRRAVSQLRSGDLQGVSLVVLHDAPYPAGAAGDAVGRWITGGGGMLIALGDRSDGASWTGATGILPGRWRSPVDRLGSHGVTLAGIDYDHPVFALFRGPESGSMATARFYRYRPLQPNDSSRTLAHYTDGGVALLERRVGSGTVLLWGSPFDNRWSDFPVQSVFLPFLHETAHYLGGITPPAPWRRSGQVLDLTEVTASLPGAPAGPDLIIESPDGRRETRTLADAARYLPLTDPGFYQVYRLGREDASYPIGVNVVRAESDLRPVDPAELAAAAGGSEARTAGAGPGASTPADRERRQGAWWFALLAVFVLLGVESILANRRRGPTALGTEGDAS